MRRAERPHVPRAVILGALIALVAGAAPALRAQIIEPRAVFASATRAATPSGEEILRRALDNLFGFDAAIALEIELRRVDGRSDVSEFLIQRRRLRDSQRLLAVSVRPAAVRGNRVLQINHDDGREETFAFVTAMDGDPVRTRYRLAELFLATWYEIGAGEPAQQTRALAEYEVLGLEPVIAAGEAAYRLTLRSIVPRGYDRTELVVARSDYVVLEQRQYTTRSTAPVLVAVAARAEMVRFGERLVPQRIDYRDRVRDVEIEVRLRHSPLADDSDALFMPSSFHRVVLPVLANP